MNEALDVKCNGDNLFAVDNLYHRLVEPMEELGDEAFVDNTLTGVAMLKQGIDHLYERLFQGAETRQEKVLEHRDVKIQDLYSVVEGARKGRDFQAYEEALLSIGEASLHARDAVGKLKYIQSRGFGEYDSKAQLTGMVRQLETKLLDAPREIAEA